MKNNDIIEVIYASDKTGEIKKYKEILVLLMNLSNEKYQITNRDREILKKHNIILQEIKQQTSNNGMQNIHPKQPSVDKREDKSFIVVSDFHSYRYPLDKIKNHYLKEYDVIYILGDATDRGKENNGAGGVQLLIDIMNLSKQYPGKVVYVPGNHDEFLLGYIRSKYHMDNYYPYDYIANLFRNGGEETINDLKKLEITDPQTFQELISWLGKQPLQRTHRYNGKEYVLGHAIFNQKLYNINPNYSLEDYFKESQYSELRRMAKDIIWFRKEKNAFNPYEMPSADKIMVIGHTPEVYTRGKNIDLVDSNGRVIKVHCVDGGIAYNGGMLKFDGAERVMWTTYLTHVDTSKLQQQQQEQRVNAESEKIFKIHILSKALNEGEKGVQAVIHGINPKELTPDECFRIINSSVNSDIAKNELEKRNIYVKTVIFDYIVESQLERLCEQIQDQKSAIYEATQMIETFLNGTNNKEYLQRNGNNGKGNYYHITSKNNARELAKIIGPKVMQEVIHFHGYSNVDEYIHNKFIKNDKFQSNNPKR